MNPLSRQASPQRGSSWIWPLMAHDSSPTEQYPGVVGLRAPARSERRASPAGCGWRARSFSCPQTAQCGDALGDVRRKCRTAPGSPSASSSRGGPAVLCSCTCAGWAAPPASEVGTYRVRYADGSTKIRWSRADVASRRIHCRSPRAAWPWEGEDGRRRPGPCICLRLEEARTPSGRSRPSTSPQRGRTLRPRCSG